ncbi:hypothetical protein BC835DRAFT_1305608 [Cytidiella melzeri]|nr:hypothetical protein BC835DRAFT_1305608 [Cytidiella melzeri]
MEKVQQSVGRLKTRLSREQRNLYYQQSWRRVPSLSVEDADVEHDSQWQTVSKEKRKNGKKGGKSVLWIGDNEVISCREMSQLSYRTRKKEECTCTTSPRVENQNKKKVRRVRTLQASRSTAHLGYPLSVCQRTYPVLSQVNSKKRERESSKRQCPTRQTYVHYTASYRVKHSGMSPPSEDTPRARVAQYVRTADLDRCRSRDAPCPPSPTGILHQVPNEICMESGHHRLSLVFRHRELELLRDLGVRVSTGSGSTRLILSSAVPRQNPTQKKTRKKYSRKEGLGMGPSLYSTMFQATTDLPSGYLFGLLSGSKMSRCPQAADSE